MLVTIISWNIPVPMFCVGVICSYARGRFVSSYEAWAMVHIDSWAIFVEIPAPMICVGVICSYAHGRFVSSYEAWAMFVLGFMGGIFCYDPSSILVIINSGK